MSGPAGHRHFSRETGLGRPAMDIFTAKVSMGHSARNAAAIFATPFAGTGHSPERGYCLVRPHSQGLKRGNRLGPQIAPKEVDYFLGIIFVDGGTAARRTLWAWDRRAPARLRAPKAQSRAGARRSQRVSLAAGRLRPTGLVMEGERLFGSDRASCQR